MMAGMDRIMFTPSRISKYPGMKSIIEDIGLSAQGQENHNVRTAIDQRGEQTINKDGKSAGKYFSNQFFAISY